MLCPGAPEPTPLTKRHPVIPRSPLSTASWASLVIPIPILASVASTCLIPYTHCIMWSLCLYRYKRFCFLSKRKGLTKNKGGVGATLPSMGSQHGAGRRAERCDWQGCSRHLTWHDTGGCRASGIHMPTTVLPPQQCLASAILHSTSCACGRLWFCKSHIQDHWLEPEIPS